MAIDARSNGSGTLQPTRPAFYNDPGVRSVFYQILVVAAVAGLGWYLVHNTLTNMQRQGIAAGFGFLNKEAAFEIAERLIDYSPADTYGKAFLVGLLNTLLVAVIGIFLATILGTLIGVARLSTNWLIRNLALCYVELFRNIPLLLQLFFWWALLRESLPGPRQALHPIPGVFLSNRGLTFPIPNHHALHYWMAGAMAIGIILAILVARWARLRQEQTGQQFPRVLSSIALVVGLPLIVFLIGGAPVDLDVPELKGFNFAGGLAVTPEFTALLIGLVVYTASFIAEIVRGGIQAVNWGQSEAAMALGLRRSWTLQLVILPQALRVIIPPMTSQYLNITKNSTLAIAIGYPDLVAIANTTINQTGQAVEGIAIIMAMYLSVSLLISLFMNWYNKHIALVER